MGDLFLKKTTLALLLINFLLKHPFKGDDKFIL